MIVILLVHVAGVGLLEGPRGTCRLRRVSGALWRDESLRVRLAGRIRVSISKVHLLEAVEHRLMARHYTLLVRQNLLILNCGKITVKVHLITK